MNIKEKLSRFKEQAKQKQIVLFVSAVYNFIWSVCKILFGVFSSAYFFCVSGASTLLFGFVKKIYLTNYKKQDFEERKGKGIIISILLIISALFFTFYMTRCFFDPEIKEYGTIMSITIATFSFCEFGFSVYNFHQSKRTNDILLQSFKGCGLISSLYAIVLTQVALLSATNTPADIYNGITGTVFGAMSVIIGVYLLVRAIKSSKNDISNVCKSENN